MIVNGTAETSWSTKPPASSCSATVPSAAQANWPGCSGSGASDRPREMSSEAGIALHWFSSGPVQAASARRPPGLRIRRVSRSAASPSAISM